MCSFVNSISIADRYQNGTSPSRTTPYESLIISDNPAGYWRLNESPHDPATNLGTVGATSDGVNANTLSIDGSQQGALRGLWAHQQGEELRRHRDRQR